jgi:hypothetical protein
MRSDSPGRSDVIDALRTTFPNLPLEPLLKIVDGYVQNETERVQIAAIYLSHGDPQRLRRLISAGNADYRDVLYSYWHESETTDWFS